MTLKTLILRYTAFAVIATLANLGAQELVLETGGETALRVAVAVLVGTGVGLVIKYLLDKRWIFADRRPDLGRQFTLYTLMGIATTAIFWGMVALFWAIWQTDLARISGAVLGLGLGYVTKYHLDRRFVFTDSTLAPAS